MAHIYNDIKSLAISANQDAKKYNDKIIIEGERELEAQARSLLADINSMWKGYYNSYKPQEYIRTGATSNGFAMSAPKVERDTYGGATVTCELILDDGSMWHNSVMHNGKRGHSFMLISEGWRWSNASIANYRGGEVYRFTNFEGVGIIDSLISRYNTSKTEFKFFFEGTEYNGKSDRGSFSFSS